jgi:hypothetical protein
MADKALADIDELIASFYKWFDNRASCALEISELVAMFTPNARITRMTFKGIEEWSVQEFVSPRATLLTDGSLKDFHEWEIEAKTVVSSNTASRYSRYEKEGALHGDSFKGGGDMFIQLCNGTEGWRICSILWEDA